MPLDQYTPLPKFLLLLPYNLDRLSLQTSCKHISKRLKTKQNVKNGRKMGDHTSSGVPSLRNVVFELKKPSWTPITGPVTKYSTNPQHPRSILKRRFVSTVIAMPKFYTGE